MDNKGFTLIEVMVSIVLVIAVLYGLSRVPIELAQLKILINEEYDSDLSVLKLKQIIDTDIIYGGISKIILEDGNEIITIGKSTYALNKLENDDEYSFKIKGINEDIIYSRDSYGFSFFHIKDSPEKRLRYLNKFSSFNLNTNEGLQGGAHDE